MKQRIYCFRNHQSHISNMCKLETTESVWAFHGKTLYFRRIALYHNLIKFKDEKFPNFQCTMVEQCLFWFHCHRKLFCVYFVYVEDNKGNNSSNAEYKGYYEPYAN